MVGIRVIVFSTLLVLIHLGGNKLRAENHSASGGSTTGGTAGAGGTTGGTIGGAQETPEQKTEREALEAQALKDATQLADALNALRNPEDGNLLENRTNLQNRLEELKRELADEQNAEKPNPEKIKALNKQIAAYDSQIKAIDAARSAIAREREANDKMAKLAKELEQAQKEQAGNPQAQGEAMQPVHNRLTGGSEGATTGTDSLSVSLAPGNTTTTVTRSGSAGSGGGSAVSGGSGGVWRIPAGISETRGGVRQDPITQLVSDVAVTAAPPAGLGATPVITTTGTALATALPTLTKDFNPNLEGASRAPTSLLPVTGDLSPGATSAQIGADPKAAALGLVPMVVGVTGGWDGGGLVAGAGGSVAPSPTGQIESNNSLPNQPDLGNVRGIYQPQTTEVATNNPSETFSGTSSPDIPENFSQRTTREEMVANQGSYLDMPTGSSEGTAAPVEQTRVEVATPGLIPGLKYADPVATSGGNTLVTSFDPAAPAAIAYNQPSATQTPDGSFLTKALALFVGPSPETDRPGIETPSLAPEGGRMRPNALKQFRNEMVGPN